LDTQKSSAQGSYNQGQAALSEANIKASALETKIEGIDNQIQQGMVQVNTLNDQIGSKETEVNSDEKSMEKAKTDIKTEQDLYNKRMKVMYTQGGTGYLDVLLDSKGISDFVSKVDIIKQITESDNNTISELNDRTKEIKQKKDAVEAEKQKLVFLQADAQKQVDSMNAQKAAQAPLMAAAKDSENSAQQLSDSAKAQIAGINKKVNDLKLAQEASNKGTMSVNRGGAGVTGNISSDAIVTYAASFRGVNYLWGGTTPSGFDCSGFVQYVYAHFGVSIPRTSQEQFKFGASVAQANLQPGDLVFFHDDGSGPQHVGMYIGGGLMINAPHTGDVVKIAPLESGYAGARRVR
jgi:cell wall-associated NlpC family hydrolase